MIKAKKPDIQKNTDFRKIKSVNKSKNIKFSPNKMFRQAVKNY